MEEGERKLDAPAFYLSQSGTLAELALLAQALMAAPGRSLPILPQGEALGSIAPGKLADLILVDGDPSVNPGDLRNPRLVVKDGVPLDPEAIWRELGGPAARQLIHPLSHWVSDSRFRID